MQIFMDSFFSTGLNWHKITSKEKFSMGELWYIDSVFPFLRAMKSWSVLTFQDTRSCDILKQESFISV